MHIPYGALAPSSVIPISMTLVTANYQCYITESVLWISRC